MNPKSKQQTLGLLQEELQSLKAMLPWLGTILEDVNDPYRASIWWLIMTACALAVETAFSYDFFHEVLRLPWWYAMLLPIGAVLTACAAFKLLLDHFYRQAQRSNVALRDFFNGSDRTNLLLKNTLLNKRSWAHNQYARIRVILASVGGIIFGSGLVLLSLERIHVKETSETSALSYGFSIALTLGGAIIAACTWHHYEKRNDEVKRIAAVKEQIKNLQIDELRLLGATEAEKSTEPSQPNSSARVFIVEQGGNKHEHDQSDLGTGAGAGDGSGGSAGWC